MTKKNAYFSYQRRLSHEVNIAGLKIGGLNPIVVQSMTISDTLNTDAVVEEAIGLALAGCQMVRVTAPTIHHAENIKNIRQSLNDKGYGHLPLVADIHFTPQAALIAAEYADKVRINPGNFADRKLFNVREYSDAEYQDELIRIREKFIPLVQKCQQRAIAMRIGTNHGSLSDRILNRYGDTPLGMVESALEFLRIAAELEYHDIVLSMKASNTQVMVQAYRLLVARMEEEGLKPYPLHLGVTEAGEGEDGRIKSAVGILSLLQEGLGDTIRVSLTEDSIYEIPVAQAMVKPFNNLLSTPLAFNQIQSAQQLEIKHPLFEYVRRASETLQCGSLALGGKHVPRVRASVLYQEGKENSQILNSQIESLMKQDRSPEMISFRFEEGADQEILSSFFEALEKYKQNFPHIAWGALLQEEALCLFPLLAPVLDFVSLIPSSTKTKTAYFAQAVEILRIASQFPLVLEWALSDDLIPAWLSKNSDAAPQLLEELLNLSAQEGKKEIMLSCAGKDAFFQNRILRALISEEIPIHLYVPNLSQDEKEQTLYASGQAGALLLEGLGDSLEVSQPDFTKSVHLSYNILQASRLRLTKTEFIACPSCGRTLFDLQTTTARIKAITGHLKGVKIAIMGCIVNGPGEMADADFGYVGGGPERIHLYVGKDCVEKNIPQELADQKLVELIKQHGRWVDPV